MDFAAFGKAFLVVSGIKSRHIQHVLDMSAYLNI